MSTVQLPVSEMLATVKSRELQRGMLAEAGGDFPGARRHYLAAAHLELVLADDYSAVGQQDLAVRSRVSAGSSLWRGGRIAEARHLFAALAEEFPQRHSSVESIVSELERDYPESATSKQSA